ncbi:MAG: hypothetical protein KDA61_17885, partial [Planctomycetales bacterium]|nr:hypothetical protein [Planctomycetales bacterium]
ADPCDVIATQGRDAFRQQLSQAKDALTHKIDAVTEGLASAADPHRASQAVESILATLARALPQAAAVASAAFVREQQTLVGVARQFGIPQQSLLQRLNALRSAARPTLRRTASSDAPRSMGEPIRLTPWEREFFELTLHEPAAHAPLLDAVGETDFASPGAQEMYRLIREQTDLGETPTFESLMLATDDLQVKNALVSCDEQGREKSDSDASQRLRGVLATLEKRRLDPQRQATIADLQNKRIDPTHEDQTLSDFFKELKSRQAGISPTEG